MSKFDVDYSILDKKLYKKAYKLSDVKDQIEKVAFDIVRFKDNDNGANLWQIHSSDDGDYIVALYKPEEEIKLSSWDVAISKAAGSIQISYKGDPLVVLPARKLGIPQNELDKVAEYLPTKLSENKKLVSSLLNELTPSAKKSVLNKYPELV